MKYYSFDTMFRSLKDLLFQYLHDNNIYFELSGAAAAWHFEILTDAAGAERINGFLDDNTIWCKGVE
jgi:hypothetical protein